MKLTRLLGSVVFSCLVFLTARAADFEGTLKWTLNAEVTDAELKAKMAETQKQMADPAKLAQMKAMLNNPQMKAMMEQNPQMRAALEAQIKLAEDAAAGKGGDMLTAMLPKTITIRTKAGKSCMVSEGGAMPMEVIAQSAPAAAYWIDRKGKTFSKLPTDADKPQAQTVAAKVTKGPGTAKILGYACDEYLVEVTREGKAIHNRIWATDAIPGLDASALSKANLGGQEAAYLAQIKGVPLKMEMTMPQMRLTLQAAAITAGAVPDAEFVVPAGFAEKPFVDLGAGPSEPAAKK